MSNLKEPAASGEGPYVGVIPPEVEYFLLANVPLDELVWPLGRPNPLAGRKVCDLSANDHLIGYAKSRTLFYPRIGVKAKLTIMFTEPAALHASKMRFARLLQWRFHRFFTINTSMLEKTGIARKFNAMGTWLTDWKTVDTTKTKMLSLIASKKNVLEGHQLRHQVADWLRNHMPQADILGRGYLSFERKSDGLAPYRYSVIIENVREENYFTEKLVDSLLCKTVPIYWGAPNVEETFDERGMIVCKSFDEIVDALSNLSAEDYLSRLDHIDRNRELAIKFAAPRASAAKYVLEEDC